MPHSRFRRPALAFALLALLGAHAQAEAIFVPGDFPTIQEALLAASDLDVILVSAGTWTGPLDTRDLDIEIHGEGAGISIIDALGAPHVLRAGFGDEVSTLHVTGFTLTGGVDGVVTTANGNVDLTHCEVRDNSGAGGRGHIAASNCTFSGNGSHGLESFDSIWNCTFEGNGGWGAQKLDGTFGSPPVELCRFLGNGLGGARLVVSSPAPAWPAAINVRKCIFVGDNLQVSALEAGGVGDTFLRQVTLLGGTVKLLQGALTVTDSILRSPTPITDLSPTGSPSVSYSNLPGAWLPGTGNIDADPLWADAPAGNYSLLPGSPCINSGNPASGKDPDDSPADMGAVPYQTWILLAGGVAGTTVSSFLQGLGPLIAGEPMGFALQPPTGIGVWLVVSVNELGAPFKGGILWPAPDAIFGPLSPLFGQIAAASWPAGLPTGFSFVAQAWWPDPGAVEGWAASNGVRGVQP